MILADSNIIIGAVNHQALRNWLLDELPAISVITQVETLGYHRLVDAEKHALDDIFRQLLILPVNDAVVAQAIHLRQQRKMSLGDSLIAATAMEHGLSLATANITDFEWVDGLTIIDPSTYLAG